MFGILYVIIILCILFGGSIKNSSFNEQCKTRARIKGTDYYIGYDGRMRNIHTGNKLYTIMYDDNNMDRLVYDAKGLFIENLDIHKRNKIKEAPKYEISKKPTFSDKINYEDVQFYRIDGEKYCEEKKFRSNLYINKKTGNICVEGVLAYFEGNLTIKDVCCYINIENKVMEGYDKYIYFPPAKIWKKNIMMNIHMQHLIDLWTSITQKNSMLQ